MHCPICKDSPLTHTDLESALATHQCERCGGHWIKSIQFWRWRETHHADPLPPAESSGVDLPVDDSKAGKLCPECGRFLTRRKVGHGVDFHLDRCENCGGMWFDRNEWHVLKSHDLHDRINHVFSDAWQARVRKAQHQAAEAQRLSERLGEADLVEVRRIRAWIDAHPNRHDILAFLTQSNES